LPLPPALVTRTVCGGVRDSMHSGTSCVERKSEKSQLDLSTHTGSSRGGKDRLAGPADTPQNTSSRAHVLTANPPPQARPSTSGIHTALPPHPHTLFLRYARRKHPHPPRHTRSQPRYETQAHHGATTVVEGGKRHASCSQEPRGVLLRLVLGEVWHGRWGWQCWLLRSWLVGWPFGPLKSKTCVCVCVQGVQERERDTPTGHTNRTSGNLSWENTMRRHVFPHAPSPTITSFFRMALAMLRCSPPRNWLSPGASVPRDFFRQSVSHITWSSSQMMQTFTKSKDFISFLRVKMWQNLLGLSLIGLGFTSQMCSKTRYTSSAASARQRYVITCGGGRVDAAQLRCGKAVVQEGRV
jgi:hypothetical protein